MAHSRRLLFTIPLLAALFIPTCNLPFLNSQGPQIDPEALEAAAAKTVEARLTSEAAPAQPQQPAQEASPTPEPPPQAQADTPTPTHTPQPMPTPTFTATPMPCNWVEFITDVTYPDGTDVETGTTFTKTWRLKNIGTCPWTAGYALIFDHGDRMNAPDDLQFTVGSIAPGATVDVSVELTAPASGGTFQGFFRLREPGGAPFGIGANALGSFWVNINAVEPAAPPPPAMADLRITQFVLDPATPTKGNPVDVTVTVYNFGDTAAGPFQVAWWPLSTYPSPAKTWSLLSMAAHGGRVLHYTYPGYPSWYPTKLSLVRADINNTVAESNEANNEMTINVKVDP